MERFRTPLSGPLAFRRGKSQSTSVSVPVLGFFEALEPRTLLASTALVDHGVLRIQGDSQNNTIDVAIAGDTVTVTCDGNAFAPFTGLGTDFSAIQVQAGAGNDAVTVEAKDLTASAGQPLRLAIQGGEGDDTISVAAENAAISGSDSQHGGLQVSIDGGCGNDAIDLVLQGFTVDETARLSLRVDGGGGDDVINILAQDTNIAGRASLQVDLGAGNDKLDLAVDGLTVAQTGKLSERINGGLGDDSFSQKNSDVSVVGQVDAQVNGGPGSDSFALTNDTVTVDGTVNAQIRGGLGDDSLTLDGTAITINGTVHGLVLGGPGTDTISNQMASDAVTQGPNAVVNVQVHDSRWESLLDGWHNPNDSKPSHPSGPPAEQDPDSQVPDRGKDISQWRRRLASLSLPKTK